MGERVGHDYQDQGEFAYKKRSSHSLFSGFFEFCFVVLLIVFCLLLVVFFYSREPQSPDYRYYLHYKDGSRVVDTPAWLNISETDPFIKKPFSFGIKNYKFTGYVDCKNLSVAWNKYVHVSGSRLTAKKRIRGMYAEQYPFNREGVDLDKTYKSKCQQERFGADSPLYDKGHLCPRSALPCPYDTLTDTFHNVTPMLAVANKGIWNTAVENHVNRLKDMLFRKSFYLALTEINGQYGQLERTLETGEKVPFYFGANSKNETIDAIPVPKIIFKIVHCPHLKKGIAYVLHNYIVKPEDCESEVKFCKHALTRDELGQIDKSYFSQTNTLCYVTTIRDLLEHMPDLPRIEELRSYDDSDGPLIIKNNPPKFNDDVKPPSACSPFRDKIFKFFSYCSCSFRDYMFSLSISIQEFLIESIQFSLLYSSLEYN